MSFLKNIFSSEEEEFQEAEVLIEEASPSCPIKAFVEQDNRVVYFYLWGDEKTNFGVKSCWVRNLKKAPAKLEEKLMDKGIPPMLPEQFCKFKEGQGKLDPNDLEIIWTEEGDAASLLANGEVIAIIPSWGGKNGFYGYARDCIGQGDFAWELTKSNEFLDRIQQSKAYWDSWGNELNPFQIQQPLILGTYDESFGKHDKYYAIDGNEWPPKGLYLRAGESKTVFATVGLSLVPMPLVEMYFEDRFESNRIELGIILNSVFSDDELQEMARWISAQSSIPWDHITFLGEGHTINFMRFNSSIFNFVWLTNRLDILPKPELEDYRGSKINFLWMVPISERERKEIMDNGSDSVIEKFNELGKDIFSLQRKEIV
ncbi:hypothetical protein B4Q04_08820 [Zobellia sp. OII3]|uniref:suppressor of fused domain protein n=1 Tax=Zobellia sp. OII3 TaxID=2034520 RepID=UPI000B5343E7|nr:suppressor of fused domain protein [Zobellia sp. OII3]OWW25696.1 hypothetical protein B4Q04_08820 [Zobellia sp. OII3]